MQAGSDRRASYQRALAWVAPLAAVLAVAGVGLGFLYPNVEASSKQFVAGPVESFAPGSVTYFKAQHFYLVRDRDGEFTAFYDLDPYQQGASFRFPERRECRLIWYDAELSTLGPNFADGVFREPCQHVRYSREGERVFGPGQANLDRYWVSLTTVVTVDLGRVTCGRHIEGSARACSRAARGF